MRILTIATACFLNPQRELLVVRKQNTRAWMLPGGKLDAGETAAEALVREIQEELQMALDATALRPLGRFEAAAANEPDTRVHAQVFLASLPPGQAPRISAEIAHMQWLPMNTALPPDVAPLLRHHIIPALQAMPPEALLPEMLAPSRD